jgi:predicted ester cyclase
MNRKKRFEKRDSYIDYINNCQLKTPEEVAKLFREYTAVIWDYKLIGKIYDFYGDNVVIYREGGNDMVGVQDVINDTLAYIAAFPDLSFEFLDIYCDGNEQDGYRFGQVVEFKGTNLGFSKYGPPTGKSLEKNGEGTLDICQCLIKFVDNRWRMHTEWGTRSEKANAEVLGAQALSGSIAQNLEDQLEDKQNSPDAPEITVLQSDINSDKIKQLESEIETIEINGKKDVIDFFKAFTSLVWDYKMPGRIYDFYKEDIVVQTSNWNKLNGIEAVVIDALDFMAAFPDLKVNLEDIIVHGSVEKGFKVFRRLYFEGSNIGTNKYGKSTGKSLGKDCLCLSMIDFEKVEGEWLITNEKFINSEEHIKTTLNKK